MRLVLEGALTRPAASSPDSRLCNRGVSRSKAVALCNRGVSQTKACERPSTRTAETDARGRKRGAIRARRRAGCNRGVSHMKYALLWRPSNTSCLTRHNTLCSGVDLPSRRPSCPAPLPHAHTHTDAQTDRHTHTHTHTLDTRMRQKPIEMRGAFV